MQKINPLLLQVNIIIFYFLNSQDNFVVYCTLSLSCASHVYLYVLNRTSQRVSYRNSYSLHDGKIGYIVKFCLIGIVIN